MSAVELSGAALDAAVAKCEGVSTFDYSPSTNWSHGGPIIEHMTSEYSFCLFYTPYEHAAYGRKRPWSAEFRGHSFYAETPLIAAMRCYVFINQGELI